MQRGGGGGGRGRGRGRGGRAGGGRGRGRGGPSDGPSGRADDVLEETSDFFGDLTGQQQRRRRLEGGREELVGEAVPVVRGGEQTQDSVMWLELGLCKALGRAVSHLGYIAPTPVQAAAIPALLSGADVCARAVTGSGKTAAFLLPLAHLLLSRAPAKAAATHARRRYVRAVVLVPTRELGVQCDEMLRQLLRFTTGLTVALAIGGVAAAAQEAALDAVPDILIATPGRLVDFLHNYKSRGLDLSGVEMLVLDECDRMLTLNLVDQVLDVLNHVPPETRQVAMFSATMTDAVDEFAREHLYRPTNIDIGHVALQAKLRQQFVRVRASETEPEAPAAAGGEEGGEAAAETKKRIRSKRLREEDRLLHPAEAPETADDHISKVKTRYLVALCQNYFSEATIVFCRYRTTAHRLAVLFNLLKLPACEIQGTQTQEERLAAFERFRRGDARYLITTDVAARGLDIKGVAAVINYDLPPTLTAYIHRVGRTARIGESGVAVSLVHEAQDADIMRKILAVSGTVNEHQVASVKRRDVPPELLRAATAAIDGVFAAVRTELAAEQLEAKIEAAEKRLTQRPDALAAAAAARPRREWCLSREESRRREKEARAAFDREAEVTVNRFQNELSNLERIESRALQRQKTARRAEREKKQRAAERLKERQKEERKRGDKKVQAGIVKKLKKRKIREAVKERRAAERVKKGVAPYKRAAPKKSAKKSRHAKRMKKH